MSYLPLTILIADDDLEDLDLIETAIAKIRPAADLQKVTSGKAVIDFLGSRSDFQLPCLMVLDYNMPDLTGPELLAVLAGHKRYDNIPKVVFSTSGAAAHIQKCMASGAIEYMVKPTNMRDLLEIAKKMLSYCANAIS